MPTAFITGATRGIGQEIARTLLAQGWDVSCVGRDFTNPLEGSHQITADLSDPMQVVKAVQNHLNTFGSVDLVANVAGMATLKNIQEQTADGWDQEFNVNVRSMFLVCQAFLDEIIKHKALVVNIGSISSYEGSKSMPAYSASKHAVLGFNRSLVKQLAGTGARSTVICPGYVATDMSGNAPVSLEEMIQPEDIARAILMLLDLSAHAHVPELEIRRV